MESSAEQLPSGDWEAVATASIGGVFYQYRKLYGKYEIRHCHLFQTPRTKTEIMVEALCGGISKDVDIEKKIVSVLRQNIRENFRRDAFRKFGVLF